MRKSYWIVAVAGLALAPWALAQTPAGQSGAADQAPAQHTTEIQLQADASPIPADQQASKEQLTKLFEVMRMRQQFDSMMKMLPNLVQQQVRAQMEELTSKLPNAKQPTPQQQAALDKLMNKYMEKALTIYPADEMIEDAIGVYQRHMNRTDVEAYIAFFSSPAGQHFLDAQPVIMKEYLPLAMGRAEAHTKELYAEMAEDLAEYIKTQAPAK
jgi:uncharacterized protein